MCSMAPHGQGTPAAQRKACMCSFLQVLHCGVLEIRQVHFLDKLHLNATWVALPKKVRLGPEHMNQIKFMTQPLNIFASKEI